jgi:hypothetical protein
MLVLSFGMLLELDELDSPVQNHFGKPFRRSASGNIRALEIPNFRAANCGASGFTEKTMQKLHPGPQGDSKASDSEQVFGRLNCLSSECLSICL